jgi:hypothetical protein
MSHGIAYHIQASTPTTTHLVEKNAHFVELYREEVRSLTSNL